MKTFRDFIFEKLGRMRIVMLGGPGSGKSTYTEYLIKHFNITHIYPGGMLRKEVEKGSEIGKIAKSIIDRGEFVPNQIVLELIKDKIEKLELNNSLIVNNFENNNPFVKAAKNLKNVEFLKADGINVYDILNNEKLVITKDSLNSIVERCQ